MNFLLQKSHFEISEENEHSYKQLRLCHTGVILQRIRQNTPNLRKILSRNGVFNEIVTARHAQLNRFSR